ncbi:MAG: HAMP domain-containing histidine kinase [Lachnospiraceae bacterium]|nr:HAMP domain-containing histidine kinase [Lachnospiraceae bacterium]
MKMTKQWMIVMGVLNVISGSCVLIFLKFMKLSDVTKNTDFLYGMVTLACYLFVISMLIKWAIDWYRQKKMEEPIQQLRNGAREVALGNYEVKLERKEFLNVDEKDDFHQLFEDFNLMVKELASTEMLKKDFVSNVSHELKTPLSVISSYATIIQSDGITEDERKEYAEKIGNAAEKLSVLVTNILELNRLDNQKINPCRESYNLSEQLSRCALGFEQIWEEKDISVSVDFDQNIILHSDEKLLDIVWNNLISNALKFTPEGGWIQISAKIKEPNIVVTVEDSGCGMTSEVKEHIFERFYQGDVSRGTEGNGLGLALVRHILYLLEGDISVESELGKGTTFEVSFIYLP